MPENNIEVADRGLSRRRFLGYAGAAAGISLLAACGSDPEPADGAGTTTSSSGGPDSAETDLAGQTLEFWDMPWGTPKYSEVAKSIVTGYSTEGMPSWSYQTIQWNNFFQTFSSAVASDTGPAVSGGGGFQAFRFAKTDNIHPANDLMEVMKKDGSYDDFLPGIWDAMRNPSGDIVAAPWAIDLRVLWYRKSLLEKAGADVPTDWDTLLSAGKALKKIGVSGFGIAGGSGYNHAPQAVTTFMINNGGGLFDKDGNLDCVTDRNIESVDFIKELVSNGIVNKAMISYSMDNLISAWEDGKVGVGVHEPGLALTLGDDSDVLVADPLVGPHGDKGALSFVNNIMMYKKSPSAAASEDFTKYYLNNMIELWKKEAVPRIPVRQSIVDLPVFQKNKPFVKIIKEYQPISHNYAYLGEGGSAALAAIDGGLQLWKFAQVVLQAETDSKKSLQDLQAALAKVI